MGIEHGLTLTLVLLLCGSAGCKGNYERDEARQVLRPNDLSEKRERALEKSRMHDHEGVLLASDNKVLGIPVPRGFTKRYELSDQTWYDGPTTPERVASYLEEHLEFSHKNVPANGAVTFQGARAKGDPDAPTVIVSLEAVAGHKERVRLVIRRPKPAPTEPLSPVEAQERLRRRE